MRYSLVTQQTLLGQVHISQTGVSGQSSVHSLVASCTWRRRNAEVRKTFAFCE